MFSNQGASGTETPEFLRAATARFPLFTMFRAFLNLRMKLRHCKAILIFAFSHHVLPGVVFSLVQGKKLLSTQRAMNNSVASFGVSTRSK
jgi:hypothetical protein